MGEDTEHEDPAALSDLVRDRELKSGNEDRFRHSDFVEELADLACSVDPPANIALYGSWGSGKSSIGNLLSSELAGDSRRVRFARFDAFKYAETPLLRSFISAIARELSLSNPEYGEDLYDETMQDTIEVKFKSLRAIAALYMGFIVAGFVIAALATVVLNATTSVASVPTVFIATLAVVLAPSAVLTAILSLANRTLPVTRKRSQPESSEQFEEIFKHLVKDARTDRLIIFVDELDRCAPNEVVVTLDTVRTFLGVEKCVFIIAADQQALEEALSRRIRQATPDDDVNPYYSAGSAYLDKIFHYQLSVPPLLPRRLTRFSLDLVENKPAPWHRDPEEIVSVLIPSHVRSPRRVKTLLNNFALAYRIAKHREEAGMLHQLDDRLTELALLVCLKTEFPIFAHELSRHSRLPSLVRLRLKQTGVDKPGEVSDAAWMKAQQFIDGSIAADVLLSETPGFDVTEDEQNSDADAPTEVLNPEAANAHAALRQELISYLSKTSLIAGPERDLIFLESPGNVFNLDHELANELEESAINGRTDQVIALAADVEQETQTGMVRLLAQRTREATIGIDGPNLARSLLALVVSLDVEVVEPAINDISDALASQGAEQALDSAELVAALRVGVLSTRREAARLVDLVLAREEDIRVNAELASEITQRGPSLIDTHREPLGVAVALHVAQGPGVASVLGGLHEEDRLPLINASEGALGRILAGVPEGEDAESAAADQEQIAATRNAYAEALTAMIELDLRTSVDRLILVGLMSEQTEIDDLLHNVVVHLPGSTADHEVCAALVAAAARRPWKECSDWLGQVPSDMPADDSTNDAARQLAEGLWEARAALDAPVLPDDFLEALELTAEVAQGSGSDNLVAAISRGLGARAPDVAAAQRQDLLLHHASQFAESGLIAEPALAVAIASVMAATLSSTPAQQVSADAVFKEHAPKWALWAAAHCSSESLEVMVGAARSSPWLEDYRKVNIPLRLAAAAADAGTALSTPLTAEEILGALDEHGTNVHYGIARWIDSLAPDVDDVAAIITRYAPEGLAERLSGSVEQYARDATEAERSELVRPALLETLVSPPSESFLSDCHFTDSDHQAVADTLVELSGNATTYEERKSILDLWQALDPSDRTIRGELIRRVLMPFASTDRETFEMVLDRSALWHRPGTEVGPELAAVLKAQASQYSLDDKARRKISDGGLDRKPPGRLGSVFGRGS